MVRLPRVVQHLDRREDVDRVHVDTLTANKIREWRYALLLFVSLYYTAHDPYPDTSVIMIVVVLGAFACLIRLRKNLLVRRQIAECIDDVFVQHRRRRVRS